MNPFSPEEIERINKKEISNEQLVVFFDSKRAQWTKELIPIITSLQHNFSLGQSEKIMESSISALSFRISISDEISLFLNKRSKEMIGLKKIKHEKLIFYSTGFGLKTNMGEKTTLIDAHIAVYVNTIELIESHIEYLRTTIKTLDSVGYLIKNGIDLYQLLGKK